MGKKKGKKLDAAKKEAKALRKEAKAEKTAQKRLDKEQQKAATTTVVTTAGGGGGADDDAGYGDAAVTTTTTTTVPTARANATFTVNGGKNSEQVFLFGGEYFDGLRTRVLDELWTYDMKKRSWKLIQPQQQPEEEAAAAIIPPARCAHSCVYYNNSLVVFGGERASAVDQEYHYHYRDCWRYDIAGRTWEELSSSWTTKGASGGKSKNKATGGGGGGGGVSTTSTPPPSARSGHAAVVWKHYMVVFGGFHHENSKEVPRWYNDVHVLDLQTLQWMEVPHSKLTKRPEKRSACNVGLVADRDCVVIQGGFSKLESSKGSSNAAAAGDGANNDGSAGLATPETIVHTDSWLLHLKPILQGKPPTWERLTSSVPKAQLIQNQVSSSAAIRNPLGRSGTRSIMYKNQLITMGGVIDKEHYHHQMESTFYNDLFAFDVSKRKWYPIIAAKAAATAKSSNAADDSKRRQDKDGDDDDDDANKNEEEDDDNSQEDDEGVGSNLEADIMEDDEGEGFNTERKSAGWDIRKLKSNMFAFTDGSGNLVFEKDFVVDSSGESSSKEVAADSKVEEEKKSPDNCSSSAVMAIDPETRSIRAAPVAPTEPLPRIKTNLVVSGHLLYVYGGLVEVGDREVTLDDMWCFDLKRRKWDCLFEGTMHRQVWRGVAEDDEDSYVSTGGGDNDEDDDDDDGEGSDDDDEEAGGTGKKKDSKQKDSSAPQDPSTRKEIADLKAEHDLLDDDSNRRTPLRGEALADFYSRTKEYWNEQAAAAAEGGEDLSKKELKRRGFSSAQARFERIEPVMERIRELELGG